MGFPGESLDPVGQIIPMGVTQWGLEWVLGGEYDTGTSGEREKLRFFKKLLIFPRTRATP